MQVGTGAGFLSLRKAINILVMAQKTGTEATKVRIIQIFKKLYKKKVFKNSIIQL